MDYEVFRVTDVQYEDDPDLLTHVFGRNQDGEWVHKKLYDTMPYLFVPERYFSPEQLKSSNVSDKVFDWNRGFESYDGVELVQIVTDVPDHVSDVKEAFPVCYESDLVFERRCTADYDLSGYIRTPKSEKISVDQIESLDESEVDPIEPRGLFIDIEVVVPETFYPEFAEDAPNEVTAVTIYDNYDDEYTLFCLDPDLSVDPTKIRDYIEENWEDHEDYDRLVDIEISFKRFGNEKNLLKSFVDYVSSREADFMTGWNYIDFDHEYLYNRIDDVLGYEVNDLSPIGKTGGYQSETYIQGIPAIDMMEAYCDKLVYGKMKSQSLDYVSKDVLGVGKIEGDDNKYDANRTKYMAYNIVDTQLCVEIDREYGVMDFWFMLADVCSIPPYEVGSPMKEVEGFLFAHRDDDEILPDTDDDKEIDTISGGFVMPPSNGLQEWVGVTDLKSLYPSSIITCNISRETMTYDLQEADIVVPDMPLNYEDVPGNEITQKDIGWNLGEGACVGFTLDEQGIMPKYLGLLFTNREDLKSERNSHDKDSREYEVFDMRQRAVKVVMNTFFGVSDHPYFRLSEDGLGAAITSVSRFVNWMGVQIITEQGYDVIYGDTDSLMVSLLDKDGVSSDLDTEKYVELLENLEGEINSQLDFIADQIGVPEKHPFIGDELHGMGRHLWVYEAEKLYRRFLQTGAKKRYAGNIVWKEGKYTDDTDVSGFETVKADSATITQDVQKEFIERVLDGQGYDDLTEFIQQYVNGLDSFNFGGIPSFDNGDNEPLEYVGFPSSLNKPPEDYPNMPVKRATLYSNEHLGYDWQSGDDPWLVYVDTTPPNLPDTDVIALSWQDESLPAGFEINVSKHLDKSIRSPLQSIVDSLDFTWRELKTGKKEQAVIGGGGGGEISFNDDVETGDPFEDIE